MNSRSTAGASVPQKHSRRLSLATIATGEVATYQLPDSAGKRLIATLGWDDATAILHLQVKCGDTELGQGGWRRPPDPAN